MLLYVNHAYEMTCLTRCNLQASSVHGNHNFHVKGICSTKFKKFQNYIMRSASDSHMIQAKGTVLEILTKIHSSSQNFVQQLSFYIKIKGFLKLQRAIFVQVVGRIWPSGCHLKTQIAQDWLLPLFPYAHVQELKNNLNMLGKLK